MSEKIFLLGDVDAIKTYVFEALGLPQIRGGSQRLVECEEEVKRYVRQEGGKEIYCSGGGFLFKVPADKAQKIKGEIERIYFACTQVATVTIVYEDATELPPPEPTALKITDGWAERLVRAYQQAQQAGEFARRTAFLAARLREAKQQKTTAPFIEAFPFGKRCDICGKRVAEYVVPYPDETKRLCRVCFQRHETGREARSEAFRAFAEDNKLPLKAQPAQDLNELVESARRSYLAFLYADGNNIGSLLQKVKNEKEFKALSEALKEGAQKALFEALWEVCQRALKEEEVWPFEILNIGGDDVTLLIQAGYAWDVAVAFLQHFEEHVRQEVEKRLRGWPESWPECITASVGIAIADAKHPVRYLAALAENLLKQAKKTAKDHNTSAIDFLWLPNAIAVTKAEMVTDQYQRGDLKLTARPYALEQALTVQKAVEILSGWPRSLRHRWSEALEQGVWSSLSLIVYDLARRSREQREEILEVLQRLCPHASPPQINPPLWWLDQDHGCWRTALLDVLELAELQAMRPDVQEEGE